MSAERNETMAIRKSTASSIGHAQTTKSKTTRKEDTMTQTSATPQGSKQAADKNAIRPFHVTALTGATYDIDGGQQLVARQRKSPA
jgi:hypothetical protein